MNRRLAIMDLWAAAVLGAISAILFVSGRMAAAATVHRYGHNVDSGAPQMFGSLLLASGAILLLFAAVALWRGWRIARVAHWLAALAAGAPVALIGYLVLFGAR